MQFFPTFSILLLILLPHTSSARPRFLPITFNNSPHQNNLVTQLHTPVSRPNPGDTAHLLSVGSGPNPGGNSHILVTGGGPNPGGNAHVLGADSGPNPGGNLQNLAGRSGPNPGGNAHTLAAGSGPNPGGNFENLAANSGPNPGGNAKIDAVKQAQSSSDSKNYQAVIETVGTRILSAESGPNPTGINKDDSSEETLLLEGQLPKGPVPPSQPHPGINSNIPENYQQVTFSKLPKGPIPPSGPSHSGHAAPLGESLQGGIQTANKSVSSMFLADSRMQFLKKQERSGHGGQDDVVACAEDEVILLCKHDIDPFQHGMIFKDDAAAKMGFGVAAARSIGL